MEHAKLMVHAGGARVNREDLVKFETPSATATWKPLPHHVLVDAIHEEVNNRNIAVVTEEYAIQRKHNMLVGTMVLNWLDSDEFAAALAFRHANDMSEAVKLYAGVRVFACDNTAVSGDEIILRKKHTKNFDIHVAIPEAFDRYKEGMLMLTRGIDELGIHVRRDDLVSVMYSTERNSATSSITRQRTDRHGILAEKSPAIQLFS